MSQIPEIDLSVIANGEPAVGRGEPAVTVIAPAIERGWRARALAADHVGRRQGGDEDLI